MKLEFTLTLSDYRSAQRLHIRQKVSRQISFFVWFILVPILALMGLIAFIALDISRYTRSAGLFAGIEGGLVWLAIFCPVSREYQIRKSFKQLFPKNRTDRSSTLEIDDTQVVSIIPGVSEGKFFWSAICGFAQNDEVTLIYVAPKRFLFFPTSAMNTEQRTELSGMVVRHVVKR